MYAKKFCTTGKIGFGWPIEHIAEIGDSSFFFPGHSMVHHLVETQSTMSTCLFDCTTNIIYMITVFSFLYRMHTFDIQHSTVFAECCIMYLFCQINVGCIVQSRNMTILFQKRKKLHSRERCLGSCNYLSIAHIYCLSIYYQ